MKLSEYKEFINELYKDDPRLKKILLHRDYYYCSGKILEIEKIYRLDKLIKSIDRL